MDVANTGGGQATPPGRRTSLLKMAGLAVVVLGGMAVVVTLGQVLNAQTFVRQPLSERWTQLLGGSGIGVTVRDVDDADMKREKLTDTAGAAVDDVRGDSPAAKAGIKAGDVIVAFDGEKVRSARHFARLVDETPEGRTVEATVMRNGERLNVKVAPTSAESLVLRSPFADMKRFSVPERFFVNPNLEGRLEILPKNLDLLANRLSPLTFLGRGRLGVGVHDLTEQLGEYFGTAGGVLVTEVDDGTPGKAAGLKAGDVITKVNGEAVRNSNDLRRRLADASGETRLTIMRDRKEQTMTVKIEDERVLSRRRISR